MSESSPRWDPDAYARNARFVAELGAPLLELLAPRAGERILDLGCGDGALTEKLVASGCDVVGIDSSPEQVAAARSRGLDARVADARSLAFVSEFDAALSNAVLHWVKDADAALASVHRALRPGARFVAELGGAGCVESIRTALHAELAARGLDAKRYDPWYFPTLDDYRGRLERAGFEIIRITLFDRPTPLPGDAVGWLETFAQSFLVDVPPGDRPRFLANVRDRLEPVLRDEQGRWTADYVRLRFSARRR